MMMKQSSVRSFAEIRDLIFPPKNSACSSASGIKSPTRPMRVRRRFRSRSRAERSRTCALPDFSAPRGVEAPPPMKSKAQGVRYWIWKARETPPWNQPASGFFNFAWQTDIYGRESHRRHNNAPLMAAATFFHQGKMRSFERSNSRDYDGGGGEIVQTLWPHFSQKAI